MLALLKPLLYNKGVKFSELSKEKQILFLNKMRKFSIVFAVISYIICLAVVIPLYIFDHPVYATFIIVAFICHRISQHSDKEVNSWNEIISNSEFLEKK